jgi:hypothetical protein
VDWDRGVVVGMRKVGGIDADVLIYSTVSFYWVAGPGTQRPDGMDALIVSLPIKEYTNLNASLIIHLGFAVVHSNDYEPFI